MTALVVGTSGRHNILCLPDVYKKIFKKISKKSCICGGKGLLYAHKWWKVVESGN